MCVCAHTQTHMSINTMHSTWYACIYTYILAHMHTHTYTHTHAQTGTLTHFKKKQNLDFLHGTVGENLPTKSEDTDSIPGLGRFHMDQSS